MIRDLPFINRTTEIPFRNKLTLITISVTAVVLLISCIGLVGGQYSHEHEKADELNRQLAKVLASNLGAAVVFEDKNTADMITRSARTVPNVLMLEARDLSGKRLSLYYDEKLTPEELAESMATVENHDYGLFETIGSHSAPIRVEGEQVGTLIIGYRYRSITSIILDIVPVAIVMLLVCLLIGLAVSNLLRKMVFSPLDRLSHSMRAVQQSGNLADRVDMTGDPDFDTIIVSYNAMLGDIETRTSELSIAMEQLAFARDQAEEANIAKSAFLANMSHELRTPLNAIIGYSEVLHDDLSKAGLTRSVEDIGWIYGSSKQLLELINGLLDLSKIEAGKMDLDIHAFSLPQLLQEVEALLQPLAAKHGTRLALSIDEKISIVRSDSTKMRQCLLNLGSNACKFTEQGFVQISAYNDGTHLVLEVSDTGIGISKENIALLFQPFVQSDSSTTRKFGGTGLGLAIVKRFTEMLGGTVDVTSDLGIGTTFTLRFPGTPSDTSPSMSSETAVQRPVTNGTDIGTKSGKNKPLALIIEDESSAVELLRRLLHRNGYRCHIANDGQAGLAMAREETPDIILLDIMLPALDGWAVLEELSQDEKLSGIPSVVISVDDRNRLSVEKGANLHLTKPIDTDELESILRIHANRHLGQILLVEDDIATGLLYEKGLIQSGFRVVRVTNGDEAAEAISKKKFSLVITDLMMSHCDGFELIDRIARLDPDQRPPIIVLTEGALTDDQTEQLEKHVAAIHFKSGLSPDVLTNHILEMLDA